MDGAIKTLTALTERNNISTSLYQCELGSCHFMKGDWREALSTWSAALENIELFFDPKSEKKALSLFGAEAQKVYKGEPYERVMLCLLSGLIYLEQDDADNALAMFKNAILHGYDDSLPGYEYDFPLAHALEALCHRLRGDEDAFRQAQMGLIYAFRAAHPFYREIISQIMEYEKHAEGLKAADPNRQAFKDAQENAFQRMEAMGRQFMGGVADYQYIAPLLAGDYNTLVVIWEGRGPTKEHKGQYNEAYEWAVDEDYVCDNNIRHEFAIKIQGTNQACDVITGVADVQMKASLQRGKRMAAILMGQARSKDQAHRISQACFEAAEKVLKNAQGDGSALALPVAAVFLLTGGASKVFAWGVDPSADTRTWENLPARLSVVPLKLPIGAHRAGLARYDFVRMHSKQLLTIHRTKGPRQIQVVLVRAMPDGSMQQVTGMGHP